MSTRTRSRRRSRTGASAHPRVQARRTAVARQRGRWRTRALVLVTGLFTVGGLGWLAIQSSFLDLEDVEVRGTQRADAADVRDAAALERGEPLLLIDRGAVASRVENLPWIQDAAVEWSFPGTLVVKVVERTPVGWVVADDGSTESGGADEDEAPGRVALVDGTGRVLDVRSRPPARLPQLDHPRSVPEPGERLEHAESVLAIASSVPDGLRSRVLGVHRASTGFVLDVEGVEIVRFGSADGLAQKWSALEAVLDELGERTVYLVDVRVPSVPAVRAQEDLPEPEPPPEETSGEDGPDEEPGEGEDDAAG